MSKTNINTWAQGCKVRAFPWIDNETIYLNVTSYYPGSAYRIEWEKSVWITDNEKGRRVVNEFLDSLVAYVIYKVKIPNDGKVLLTF